MTRGFFIDYQIVILLARLDQNNELVYSLISFQRALFKGDVPFLKLVKLFSPRGVLILFPPRWYAGSGSCEFLFLSDFVQLISWLVPDLFFTRHMKK